MHGRMKGRAAAHALAHEPLASQDLVDRVAIGPDAPGILAAQPVSQLAGAPARMRGARGTNAVDDDGWRGPRTGMRAPRGRLEMAVAFIAIDPVIADAAADTVRGGELSHGVQPSE